MIQDIEQKIEALAQYLGVSVKVIDTGYEYSSFNVKGGGAEYFVYTDEEAEEAAAAAIARTVEKDLADAPKYLLPYFDWDSFVKEALLVADRGTLLSEYNHEEVHLNGGYYAYRIN